MCVTHSVACSSSSITPFTAASSHHHHTLHSSIIMFGCGSGAGDAPSPVVDAYDAHTATKVAPKVILKQNRKPVTFLAAG